MNNKITQKRNKTSRKKREFRKKCEDCGTMSKAYRMFDIDGTNLVEHLVCLNCGLGRPSLK
ncbi:MAG: hypothetical protein U9Q27_01750 [Patescibacteria group bacterium]|nr:hypothetical protein [Patescibacteria group bacterium]